MNAEQLNALRIAIDAILDAAKVAGPMGAPSGIVYAAMSAHGMRLEAYLSLLGALERAGKITVEYDCIHLAA